jgi:glyoxylase-like metal-dependent hydrolase (beta-lactamase superfamily II)
VVRVADRIWRVDNRVFPSNTYICATGKGNDCFLVDPGLDPAAIDAALGTLSLEPRQVFCTHGHFDHAGSASFFQDKYGAPCHLHGADLKTLRGSKFLLMVFKIPFAMELPRTVPAEELVMPLGGQDLRFLFAPGHTPGSCVILYGNSCFTGDTLYRNGVGLSKLPGENAGQLKTTLLDLWQQLPGEALILPGHGECGSFNMIQRENAPLLDFLGLAQAHLGER